MLQAELEVCTDCGVVHMDGGPAPTNVDECSACGGRVEDVELDDLVGL
jgi:rRNA maturation endonuclease Nob1